MTKAGSVQEAPLTAPLSRPPQCRSELSLRALASSAAAKPQLSPRPAAGQPLVVPSPATVFPRSHPVPVAMQGAVPTAMVSATQQGYILPVQKKKA